MLIWGWFMVYFRSGFEECIAAWKKCTALQSNYYIYTQVHVHCPNTPKHPELIRHLYFLKWFAVVIVFVDGYQYLHDHIANTTGVRAFCSLLIAFCVFVYKYFHICKAIVNTTEHRHMPFYVWQEQLLNFTRQKLCLAFDVSALCKVIIAQLIATGRALIKI